MNAQEIEKLLQGEIVRRSSLQSAVQSLQKQLEIIDARIKSWEHILTLQQMEVELQGPIAEVLHLLSANGEGTSPDTEAANSGEDAEEDDDGSTEGGGVSISRTLGKRIYAIVAEYLNQPGYEMAPVQRLYDILPAELRAEIEAIPSSKTPVFRFRRLLRRNKKDFAVDRYTGVVTYLHYAPTATSGPDTPPPTTPNFSEMSVPTILGKRFDATDGWMYQFRNPGNPTLLEGSAARFFAYFAKAPGKVIKLRRGDGSLIGVAQVGERLVSYDGDAWTTDLEYGLQPYTGS